MDFVSIKRPDQYDGRIAIVSFDRGNRANALSRQLMSELTQTAQALEDELDLAAIILTGRADAFSMGVDLKETSTAPSSKRGLAHRRLALKMGPRLCAAWERLDMITIAAIEGWCVGGGVALAASCDLRAAGKGAQFYVPEVERGMNLGWGAVPRLVALCGPAKAKRLVSLCEKWSAEESLAYGLIDAIAPPPQTSAVDQAIKWAERAASLPPNAVRTTKRDINAAAFALADLASRTDMDGFALNQTSEDFAEGVSSFIEKRPPKFTGR